MKTGLPRRRRSTGKLSIPTLFSPLHARLTAALLFLAVLSALTSGCGFQLRGELELPSAMDAVMLQGIDRYSEQGQDIVVSLVAVGSRVTQDPVDATSVLRITHRSMERRVLSVDAAGKANEYELIYRLSFLLEDKTGEILVPTQTILQVRDYIFDLDNVLGKSEEEALLRRQLEKDAALRMLRRLEAGLRVSPRAMLMNSSVVG